MRDISKIQFDAFCYSRQPMIRMLSREVSWFEAFDRKILAIIILDLIDHDYGFIILGRDNRNIFRAIKVSNDFYPTDIEALESLKKEIEKYKDDGCKKYPQGDEKESSNELFVPVVADKKLHEYFKVLSTEPRYEAARNIIKEMVYSFIDPDGHYIREFQTNGFNARLWELYLYVYLYNEGFEIIRDKPSPDYHIITHQQEEVLIEAVTVNPSENIDRPDAKEPETDEEIRELLKDYMPIKFGSPLYSKLQKKYWKLNHVKEKPLIFAIHDFHQPSSMTWSRSGLQDYLYGIRWGIEVDENGKRSSTFTEIKYHSWEGKSIPSGFFKLPNSENVSAVLYNNSATIPKFNRMGKLAGLGCADIKMIRKGYKFNPANKALDPIIFSHDIDDEDYEESWSDSLIMFHNPYALHPINPELFSAINHIFYDKESNEFLGISQPHHVISSVTVVCLTEEHMKKT